VYAPAVGVLNGSRRFGAQAALDMLSVTLRTLALFGGAWWLLDSGSTRAVEGASWGFVAVALLLACLAVLLVGLGKTGKSVLTAREHLGFVVPVILAQVVLNLLLQADTNTLRGFATRAAVADGREPEAADALVGAYNAAQLFGFLPYQLLVGVTFILFPLLATAHAGADRASVARYVREGTRIALLVIGLSVGISAGLSEGLLRLVFPPQFAELGTSSLRVLSVGLGAFALFGVMTTVLNSLGRQWQSLLVTGLALGVVFVLNLWWLRGEPFGRGLLEKTAWATSLGMFAAAAVSAFLVKRAAGASFEPSVLLRVVVAVLACVLVARQLPASSKPLTVVLSLALALGYLGVLIVLRVLGPNDWRRVMSIVGRSR
jgi:stage V sporulation protein B